MNTSRRHKWVDRTGSIKITKQQWLARGAFRNTKLWRRQDRQGRWHYYQTKD